MPYIIDGKHFPSAPERFKAFMLATPIKDRITGIAAKICACAPHQKVLAPRTMEI